MFSSEKSAYRKLARFTVLFIIMVLLVTICITLQNNIYAEDSVAPTAALQSKLDSVYAGDIDIYSNYACTNEVFLPVGSSINNYNMYHIKSKITGSVISGWQCYIYANAVYNKIFNEWIGHGYELAHSHNVISAGTNYLNYNIFRNAGVKSGAYIRTTTYSSGAYNGSAGHSMIVISYNTEGITYLEGNGNGYGLIRITTVSWEQFSYSQLYGCGRYICHVIQPEDSYYDKLYGNDAVLCSHNNIVYAPEVESTCTLFGHESYAVCSDCYVIVSDYISKPLAPHTGGNATCTEQAICDHCGIHYGEYAPHKFAEKESEYYIKTPADCVSCGEYYKSCSYCGLKSTETFKGSKRNPDKHIGEPYIQGQIESSCIEHGYTGDVMCGKCNNVVEEGSMASLNSHQSGSRILYDENYHWQICAYEECDKLIKKAEHVYGDTDESNEKTCRVCGYKTVLTGDAQYNCCEDSCSSENNILTLKNNMFFQSILILIAAWAIVIFAIIREVFN